MEDENMTLQNLDKKDRDFVEEVKAIVEGRSTLKLTMGDGQCLVAILARLDAQLTEAKVEKEAWFETARQNQCNTDYYRNIVIKIGELFGKPAYTSDDGSIQDNVLCAKVFDLVKELIAKLENLK